MLKKPISTPILPFLAEKYFFSQKLGPITFYNTQRPNIMPKVRKINELIFWKSSGRTHRRTDKGQSIGPYLQRRRFHKCNLIMKYNYINGCRK